ncbi:hypothetical protein SFRURICE_020227 [Spodoptera frugiperda]|nr:hypothetical protein SFRURICE_020227 [Spodoptera frugiperda]
MIRRLVILHFLFLPYFVALEESSVYEYNANNFKIQIEEMDGNFIMFYAPWCRHCTEFHPIWSELAELVNTKDSKFAIAQVDCTIHFKLCNENDITGYPTLLYFHKNTFSPVEYKGTRDLPSLTLFLSEVFAMKSEGLDQEKESREVKTYSGMAYLNDQNIEKFVSRGQHFIMFYAPWCKASQMGVAEAETIDDLKGYVEKMLLTENHDPEKFLKKKKALPVARISEETFETFLEKELVFINYFAPWCAHCMQLSPLWLKLGERFQNETRVIIADVDCVQSKPICETEKISGLPTLILYKEKKIVNVEHGGRSLESLITLVNEHLQGTNTSTEQGTTNDEDITKTKDEL